MFIRVIKGKYIELCNQSLTLYCDFISDLYTYSDIPQMGQLFRDIHAIAV